MNAVYAFHKTHFLPLLSHWSSRSLVVGDYIRVDTQKVDAQVRSGDYFVMLATLIEVLSQRPAHQTMNFAPELERIANELLYLQNYYDIVRKVKSDVEQMKP